MEMFVKNFKMEIVQVRGKKNPRIIIECIATDMIAGISINGLYAKYNYQLQHKN